MEVIRTVLAETGVREDDLVHLDGTQLLRLHLAEALRHRQTTERPIAEREAFVHL